MRRPVSAVLGAVIAVVLVGAGATGCAPSRHVDPLMEDQYIPSGGGSGADVPVGECPWADEQRSASSAPSGSTDVAITEALALAPDDFWAAVESVGASAAPETADDPMAGLTSQLAGCSEDGLIAFDARLTLALWALDGPDQVAWAQANLGEVSDDGFLYDRLATVLAGREVWERAVESRTVPQDPYGFGESGDSELLLYVAMDAATAQGGSADEFLDREFRLIPLSFETGSNTRQWGS